MTKKITATVINLANSIIEDFRLKGKEDRYSFKRENRLGIINENNTIEELEKSLKLIKKEYGYSVSNLGYYYTIRKYK